MWKSSSTTGSHEVAAFGKLPWAGDFVQVGTTAQSETLIAWLEHGIAVGSARGEAWKAEFEAGVPKGFVVPGAEQDVFVGVIVSSRDLVGRRFPFVVYSRLQIKELLAAPHIGPLALGGFLQQAGAEISALQLEESNVAAAISRITPPEVDSFLAHEQSYRAWTQSASLQVAGEAIFGESWRDELAYALYVTDESVRPFVGKETPNNPLGVRFALGSGLSGAATMWIEIVRRLAGWKTTVPGSIWSFEAGASSLTVELGGLSANLFADIWEAQPKNENLSNLVAEAAPSGDFLGQRRPQVAGLLQSPGATVAMLLEQLVPLS